MSKPCARRYLPVKEEQRLPRRPHRKFGPSQKDRLFFACLPDAKAVNQIHNVAQALKEQHALTAPLVLPEHLHVTLFHLGDWNKLPVEVIGLARQAARQDDPYPAWSLAAFGS